MASESTVCSMCNIDHKGLSHVEIIAIASRHAMPHDITQHGKRENRISLKNYARAQRKEQRKTERQEEHKQYVKELSNIKKTLPKNSDGVIENILKSMYLVNINYSHDDDEIDLDNTESLAEWGVCLEDEGLCSSCSASWIMRSNDGTTWTYSIIAQTLKEKELYTVYGDIEFLKNNLLNNRKYFIENDGMVIKCM
jgi:hypothetical protein